MASAHVHGATGWERRQCRHALRERRGWREAARGDAVQRGDYADRVQVGQSRVHEPR